MRRQCSVHADVAMPKSARVVPLFAPPCRRRYPAQLCPHRDRIPPDPFSRLATPAPQPDERQIWCRNTQQHSSPRAGEKLRQKRRRQPCSFASCKLTSDARGGERSSAPKHTSRVAVSPTGPLPSMKSVDATSAQTLPLLGQESTPEVALRRIPRRLVFYSGRAVSRITRHENPVVS
eukprot:scaffold7625_cov277-Pinguiococcus_pyrenoidosus.AAC.3